MLNIVVNPQQVTKAEEHIQNAIDNAHTAVDLTAKGVLAHVLMSLGIGLAVQENTTLCGHTPYGRSKGVWRCSRMDCENYYMKHWTGPSGGKRVVE